MTYPELDTGIPTVAGILEYIKQKKLAVVGL
jgi:hypothetical protein